MTENQSEKDLQTLVNWIKSVCDESYGEKFILIQDVTELIEFLIKIIESWTGERGRLPIITTLSTTS
jgi:hypothetical protein